MKRITGFIVLILLLSITVQAQSPNCKAFRNGIFTSIFEGNTDSIKREGALQLEYFNGAKDPDRFFVKWLDDCTYTLTPYPEVFEKNKNLPANVVFTVKILNTTKNSYTQTTSINVSTYTVTCEMIKIKPQKRF
jgi:hypothetical protein